MVAEDTDSPSFFLHTRQGAGGHYHSLNIGVKVVIFETIEQE